MDAQLLHRLPKAELHLHIEGTLEPEMMFAMAQRNGVTLPYASADDVREAYVFDDLQSFLDIYYLACQVLVTQQDFYDLTWAYLQRAGEQGVRHAEIFFDPQSHTSRGVAMETVIHGISQALHDARERFGLTSRLILCFLRHLSSDEAMATLESALPYKEYLTAVGLDSSEVGHPPRKFTAVFRRARDAGLEAVAHAGEEGPPEYIWEALDTLKVSRIDHGVRCLEDRLLVERLVRERIPLTVCPLSNVKLRVVPRLEDHNLREMLRLGIVATVNSDDPAYFGGYVGDNFVAARAAMQLTTAEIVQLARNSFEAAFLDEATRQHYLTVVDEEAAALPA